MIFFVLSTFLSFSKSSVIVAVSLETVAFLGASAYLPQAAKETANPVATKTVTVFLKVKIFIIVRSPYFILYYVLWR